MKREEIRKIFTGATREQIDQVIALNGADISRALVRRKGESTAQRQRTAETIRMLEERAAEADNLRGELEKYQREEAQRQAARQREELLARMDAVLNGRSFVSDRLREVVADDFAAALADEANRERSDAEIFDGITRDRDYFASQNPAPPMAAFAAIDAGRSRMNAMRTAMNLPLGE